VASGANDVDLVSVNLRCGSNAIVRRLRILGYSVLSVRNVSGCWPSLRMQTMASRNLQLLAARRHAGCRRRRRRHRAVVSARSGSALTAVLVPRHGDDADDRPSARNPSASGVTITGPVVVTRSDAQHLGRPNLANNLSTAGIRIAGAMLQIGRRFRLRVHLRSTPTSRKIGCLRLDWWRHSHVAVLGAAVGTPSSARPHLFQRVRH